MAITKLMNAVAAASGATLYSTSYNLMRGKGHGSVLITLSSAIVTVSQQCSVDNATFYNPLDPDGNALGTVYTSMSDSSYIQADLVFAKYIRYKAIVNNTAGAGGTINLYSISEEE